MRFSQFTINAKFVSLEKQSVNFNAESFQIRITNNIAKCIGAIL